MSQTDTNDAAGSQEEIARSWRLPLWNALGKREQLQDVSSPDGTASHTLLAGVAPQHDGAVEREEDVEDEGVSMAGMSSQVDFLGSLPLEISLYILFLADIQTVCRAMQVSRAWRAVASDPSLWREHFYQNPGWHIHAYYLAHPLKLITSKKIDTKTNSLFSPPGRPRSQAIGGEASITSRISRRISDLVYDMGYLALHSRTPPRVAPNLASREDEHVDPFLSHVSTASRPPAHCTPQSALAALRSPSTGHILQSTQNRAHLPDLQIHAYTPTADNPPVTISSSIATDSSPEVHSNASLQNTSPSGKAFHSQPSDIDTRTYVDWRDLYKDRFKLDCRWKERQFSARIFEGHKDSVYCFAVRGNILASGSRDRTIKVWKIDTGELLRTIERHTASVLAMYLDDELGLTSSSSGELFVWDPNTWTHKHSLSGHTGGVLDVQANTKWLASCSKDTSVRIWSRDTLEPHRVLQGHRGPVNAVQLWEDYVISASGDALAKLWSIETGQVVRVFMGHDRGLACIQYNGKMLITGSNDHTIRIWDTANGECIRVLRGHEELVRTLAFDPHRRKIYSGSYDKTTRLWDLDTGELEMTLDTAHRSLVFNVGMDVSRLISSSHDRRIVLLDFGVGLHAERFV